MPRTPLRDQAVARRTDPHTSHEAAASVGALRPRQQAVLDVLRADGAMTDQALATAYYYTGLDVPQQSPSGLRTRRCELVDLGMVIDTGERRRLPSGRQAIVWAAVPKGDGRLV